ncbi:MAG: hypothetical protein OEQ39_10540 [Gammaproteobacteria bacterium]|nr:hypothetical protein [Gammaproteobacteria bacterium]MDH3467728.1 hypothetical protein [Gammaproteobacteria bacterium]
MFDLAIDPNEFHNRADDPDYRSVMLRYAQKMLTWRMNNDERVLTNIKLTTDGVRADRGRS